MKNFSFFNLCPGLVLLALIVGSCSYDPPIPIAGEWVLKYSDGGTTNTHKEYPQDSFFTRPAGGTYFTWASNLYLLENDSAYWNSSGIDMDGYMHSSGLYSISSNGKSRSTIELSFSIGRYSTFEFTLKGKDTLQLNDLSSTPFIYTYVRK